LAAEDWLPYGGWFPEDDFDQYDGIEPTFRRRSFREVRKPQYPVNGIKFTAEDIRKHTRRMQRLMREMNSGGTVAKNKVNKFYVAATNISEAVNRGHNADWTRPSMAAAIEHAKEILEDNPDRDCVVIVEIKKIVRRASRPIVVENVD
jgi:hypothetical protein